MTFIDRLREQHSRHDHELRHDRDEEHHQWMRQRQDQHDEWMREEDRKHFRRMLIMGGIIGVLSFTATLLIALRFIPWLFN